MFVGHYAAAFAGKRIAPKAPMWGLLVAAQAVDFLWAGLVLGGVERAELDHSLPTNPLVAEHMPYSHSLLGTLVVAVLMALMVGRLWRSSRAAWVAGAVVVSHWFCDLLMHRPDLTLYGLSPKLGLQLWNYPLASHVLELALLAAAVSWLMVAQAAVTRRNTMILAGVLVVSQLYAALFPPPPTIALMCFTLLLSWAAYPALAAWLEHRARPGQALVE